ncbi:UDP-3-O-[3-hydroxymyristoyl] N-acetylglucosamine deacetylase [Chromatiales bacterium (ex Bugula neritina AB1)]|nr:UDP-3-O-[3-hydroxymyristoyl] N-acetylglucosamine deacetylase [Chromatiales bacterium (ex Bugula neritina AB1)]
MIRQRTLNNPIHATGVGLHTGRKVYLTLSPAPINTGIVFRRDLGAKTVSIPATAEKVVSTELATTIGDDEGNTISTIEHLMAAFAGLGIDNCFVDVSAREVPIMDGSAAPFIFLIQSAGIREQVALKKFVKINEPIIYEEDDKWVRFDPYDGFRVNFEIDFKHPAIAEGAQTAIIDFSSTSFIREISRARTFGFMSDIEELRKRDLALGGCLDNAIVVDNYKVLNTDGLRYDDEFVRHKILDAIGDLFQLGSGVIGQFTGYKSGHGLNNKLVRTLLQQPESWEEVTFEEEEAPILYSQPLAVAS